MRLLTIFISTTLVLVGMSAALSVERENMLAARSADSDFFAKVDARAYGEEPELSARGCALSKLSCGQDRDNRPPPSESSAGTSMIVLPPLLHTVSTQSDYSGTTIGSSSSHLPLPRTGSAYSGTTSTSSRYRRPNKRKTRHGLKLFNS